MLSRFDLSRAIAVIDLVTLSREWNGRCDVTYTLLIGGRRTSKETKPIRVRDHHKLSRAVCLVSPHLASPLRLATDWDVMRAWRFICHCRSSSRARRAIRHNVPHRKRMGCIVCERSRTMYVLLVYSLLYGLLHSLFLYNLFF